MPTFTEVDRDLLRGWPLPAAGESKYERGNLLVLGGALRSPGAAMLAGASGLRVGAGRLTLAVGRSVAAQVGVALPESGLAPLGETVDGHIDGDAILSARADVAAADCLLVGPGLDDAAQTLALVRHLPALVNEETVVVLDAFALGSLAQDPAAASAFVGRLILTPNSQEAELLLGHEPSNDVDDARELADRYGAAVSYSSVIAAPNETPWLVRGGNPGLGTSGSGDVLAGAIAGLSARGASIAQAAVWGTWAHSNAGDRLAKKVGPLGYLASELVGVLPRVLARASR